MFIRFDLWGLFASRGMQIQTAACSRYHIRGVVDCSNLIPGNIPHPNKASESGGVRVLSLALEAPYRRSSPLLRFRWMKGGHLGGGRRFAEGAERKASIHIVSHCSLCLFIRFLDEDYVTIG
jgi:hypothetical protein